MTATPTPAGDRRLLTYEDRREHEDFITGDDDRMDADGRPKNGAPMRFSGVHRGEADVIAAALRAAAAVAEARS